jgi:hypothetical protein
MNADLRILTVRQPWAWAIIHGGKDVENRVRNIAGAYRGPVAVHAGMAWDWDTTLPVGETPHPTSMSLTRGAIIGVVDLVDVHRVANSHFHPICYDLTGPNGLLEAAERGDGACSPWSTANAQWHLVLANPRPLADPIPYKGALGLRRLDSETAARVWGGLA